MREDLVKLATGKAAAYCAKRERTAQDVHAYLVRYDLREEEMTRVLEDLQRNSFLDEERYARAFSKDRFRFNKWGRNKIRHALRAKQVPEVYIEVGTSALSDEEYRQTAVDLLSEKYHALGNMPELEKKAKTARFMVGKGYETDLIYDLLNDLPG